MLELISAVGDLSVIRNVLLEFIITGFLSYIVTFIVNIYLKLKQHHAFVNKFNDDLILFKKNVDEKFEKLDDLISHKTDVIDIKIKSLQMQLENHEKNIDNVQENFLQINNRLIND